MNNIQEAGREFYLNADFDRTLRGIASLLDDDYHTYIHEMSQHFLFAAAPEDSVIVHRPLPAGFLAYIARKRLALPAIKVHPDFTPSARFTPFGWNTHASRLNLRYARPSPHSDLEAVRAANSRVFSHALEKGEAGDPGNGGPGGIDPGSVDPGGGLFDSLPALEAYLLAHPSAEGWVAKGNHGHAGTANRRILGATLGEEERRGLELLFREDRWVALEPWHERLLDLSANFHVDPEGGISGFRGHTLVNSRDGAFLGVRIAPSGQPPEPWRGGLEAAAGRLGKALRGIGYSGPVSMDAYVRKTPAGPVLRPWVDINARLSMALPAHGLSQRLPGRYLYWHWAKPRKLSLPGDYEELQARLGPADFDPETRRGILAASPLTVSPRETTSSASSTPEASAFAGTPRAATTYNAAPRTTPARDASGGVRSAWGRKDGDDEGPRRAKRVAFVLVGRSEEDLAVLEAAFRNSLGREA